MKKLGLQEAYKTQEQSQLAFRCILSLPRQWHWAWLRRLEDTGHRRCGIETAHAAVASLCRSSVVKESQHRANQAVGSGQHVAYEQGDGKFSRSSTSTREGGIFLSRIFMSRIFSRPVHSPPTAGITRVMTLADCGRYAIRSRNKSTSLLRYVDAATSPYWE